MRIDNVEQHIEFHVRGNIQDVNVYLESPSGTNSYLIKDLFHDPIKQEKLNNADVIKEATQKIHWDFGNTHFRGESAEGKWKLLFEIKQDSNVNQQTAVFIENLILRVHGKAENSPKQIIYTNEFFAIKQ